MKKIKLSPKAAWFVAQMLRSCGNQSCDLAVAKLLGVTTFVYLDEFTTSEGWLKPVFGNLQEYALKEGLKELDVREVVRYFGGTHHINHMLPKVFRSNLKIILGDIDTGLVLDVLLPIENGAYQNGDVRIEIEDLFYLNPDDPGRTFAHRGLAINVPVTADDVLEILTQQKSHPDFARALSRVPSKISLPPNLKEAYQES